MKMLKILFVLCILFGFAVNKAQSQAASHEDLPRILWTDLSWTFNGYISVDDHLVLTPCGNVLRTVTYQLSLDDPLVPKKGVNKVEVWGSTDHNDWIWSWDGMLFVFEDVEMIVQSNGKAKIVYHLRKIEM
jgi:hypothetical protein